jgi:Xaa-Pro aminopeptidase
MLLPADTYQAHRRRLAAQLLPGAVAVLVANDVMPTNTDGVLVYLTGLPQPHTALILCPNHPREELREVLFIRRLDEQYILWNGPGLTREDATARSGISTVRYFDELEAMLRPSVTRCEHLYLLTNEHPRSENQVPTAEDRLLASMRQAYPLHQYHRLYPLLARQRTSKTSAEVEALRQACAITEAGFRRLLRTVRPGVMEYQVEAELLYEYKLRGAARADYEPIVAGGASTCALHYRANNQECRAGELLLVDAGAAWHYYNADLTRVIPISGRYSPRQRAYYAAVLRVQREMQQAMRAGSRLVELQAQCNELLVAELIGLGLCTAGEVRTHGPQYYLSRYCYHGFSHLLGLDVHDVGYHDEPLPVGAVLTNEPGIYNREEGIGIRLENNLLLTENGVEDLTATIPIDPDEIEQLMNP